jgi:hypothetical protein
MAPSYKGRDVSSEQEKQPLLLRNVQKIKVD